MAFNIEEFKANGLIRGGARNTQFIVSISPPAALGIADAARIQFVCKASQIPPMILSPIDVSYFGRKTKFAGDREFPDWSVTIYNDEDFYVRKMLEKWSNAMNTLVSNVMGNEIYPTDYKTSAIVYQYAKNGDIASAYRFEGLFPTQIDGIPLDWEAVNQIEQFECTFAYDYWEPETVSLASDVDYTTTTPEDGIAERRTRTTLT